MSGAAFGHNRNGRIRQAIPSVMYRFNSLTLIFQKEYTGDVRNHSEPVLSNLSGGFGFFASAFALA